MNPRAHITTALKLVILLTLLCQLPHTLVMSEAQMKKCATQHPLLDFGIMPLHQNHMTMGLAAEFTRELNKESPKYYDSYAYIDGALVYRVVLGLREVERRYPHSNTGEQVLIRWDYNHSTNEHSAYLHCNNQTFNLYGHPAPTGEVGSVRSACDRQLSEFSELNIHRISNKISNYCGVNAYHALIDDHACGNAVKIFESYLIDECNDKSTKAPTRGVDGTSVSPESEISPIHEVMRDPKRDINITDGKNKENVCSGAVGTELIFDPEFDRKCGFWASPGKNNDTNRYRALIRPSCEAPWAIFADHELDSYLYVEYHYPEGAAARTTSSFALGIELIVCVEGSNDLTVRAYHYRGDFERLNERGNYHLTNAIDRDYRISCVGVQKGGGIFNGIDDLMLSMSHNSGTGHFSASDKKYKGGRKEMLEILKNSCKSRSALVNNAQGGRPLQLSAAPGGRDESGTLSPRRNISLPRSHMTMGLVTEFTRELSKTEPDYYDHHYYTNQATVYRVVLELSKLESRSPLGKSRGEISLIWEYNHGIDEYYAYVFCNSRRFNLYKNMDPSNRVDPTRNVCNWEQTRSSGTNLRDAIMRINAVCHNDAYYTFERIHAYDNAVKIFESYLIDECNYRTAKFYGRSAGRRLVSLKDEISISHENMRDLRKGIETTRDESNVGICNAVIGTELTFDPDLDGKDGFWASARKNNGTDRYRALSRPSCETPWALFVDSELGSYLYMEYHYPEAASAYLTSTFAAGVEFIVCESEGSGALVVDTRHYRGDFRQLVDRSDYHFTRITDKHHTIPCEHAQAKHAFFHDTDDIVRNTLLELNLGDSLPTDGERHANGRREVLKTLMNLCGRESALASAAQGGSLQPPAVSEGKKEDIMLFPRSNRSLRRNYMTMDLVADFVNELREKEPVYYDYYDYSNGVTTYRLVLELARPHYKLPGAAGKRIYIYWDYVHDSGRHSTHFICYGHRLDLHSGHLKPRSQAYSKTNACNQQISLLNATDILIILEKVNSQCKIAADYALSDDYIYETAAEIFESYLIDECNDKDLRSLETEAGGGSASLAGGISPIHEITRALRKDVNATRDRSEGDLCNAVIGTELTFDPDLDGSEGFWASARKNNNSNRYRALNLPSCETPWVLFADYDLDSYLYVEYYYPERASAHITSTFALGIEFIVCESEGSDTPVVDTRHYEGSFEQLDDFSSYYFTQVIDEPYTIPCEYAQIEHVFFSGASDIVHNTLLELNVDDNFPTDGKRYASSRKEVLKILKSLCERESPRPVVPKESRNR